MRASKFYLREFIKESIMTSTAEYCQKFNAHRGYYDLDPKNALPLKDVVDGWAKCGLKAIEQDTFHAFYSPEELWKYRESRFFGVNSLIDRGIIYLIATFSRNYDDSIPIHSCII